MANESNYLSKPYVYDSRGLVARYAPDQAPEYTYLQLMNLYERQENSLSSRYGVAIINRSAAGQGVSNYFFASPVTSLSRLTFAGSAFRYAGLANGTLWRRGGSDGSGGSLASPLAQGPYSQLATPTFLPAPSGSPFQSLVASCYASAQAYLFIADEAVSLRDSGTGNPSAWGIDPPALTVNAVPYSPLLTLIDDFSASNTYSSSGFDGSAPWSYSSITTITASSSLLVTDFPEFLGVGGQSFSAGTGTQTATGTTPGGFGGGIANLFFPAAAITSGETVTLSVVMTGQSVYTGTAVGTVSALFQYSPDGGSTWIDLNQFYEDDSSLSQAFGPTSVTLAIPSLTNLNQLQVRIDVTGDFLSGAGSIQMTGAVTSCVAAIVNPGVFGDVCDGILSVLESGGGGGGGSVPGQSSATVYAAQYATNLTFNSSQYEFNSNLLRTKGGVEGGVLTDYVTATGFGFSIPPSATVTGVTATLVWSGQQAGTGTLTNAALFHSGGTIGVVKSSGVSNAASLSPTPLGSATDLWGTAGALTPALVNSASFGFGVQITTAVVGGTDRSFLYTWQITVSYTTPGGGGGSQTVTALPIVSIASSNLVGGLYQSLTVIVAGVLPGSLNVAIYGSSNNLVDGFYPGTGVSSTALTVPFLSPVYLSATGGTLYCYASGSPSDCILTNQYSAPYPAQMSAWGFYQQVPLSQQSFPIGCFTGKVDTNSTATVEVVADFNLSQQNQVNDSDLVVLTLRVGAPANIASIQLAFDVNDSAYTSSYYYANIAPAFYQGNVAGEESAYQTTQNQILGDALGLLTEQPVSSTTAQLQPSNFSTGSGSWVAVLIPRGNFLPVGSAGQSGLDWTNITGWRVEIQTTAAAVTGDGSSTVACNGLYLQWGYGPSSFAGVGYDYRYTYFNIATFTESSPSPSQEFSQQWGYLSSLSAPFFLRQAVQLTGQYSADPQVTHLRIYRRGGTYASNWLLIDQVQNLTAQGQFVYKDVVPDASLAQAQPLALDNDPPVTSTLTTPINTTLAAATTCPGNTIYSTFAPQLVQVVALQTVFVPNQLVLVGNASNLELVTVVTGGTGQFTATLRLQHNAGEPVQVNSLPRVPCNLCAISNSGGVQVVWLAGDPNNPNYLYYSKPTLPENFGPQNRIPVSAADDPIMAVVNWRGTIVCATLKTWYVIVGGSSPYAQPTGAAHGLVAQEAWTLVDGAIWFRAADGLRVFSGADGEYATLPVEWLYQGNPALLPPQVSASNSSQDVMAYFNNTVYTSYISTTGTRYRLDWHTQYKRFRMDDLAATAMLWERDTNQLLLGIPVPGSASNSAWCVAADQQYSQDYDDGGWVRGRFNVWEIAQVAVQLTIQTPYRDLGKPHHPKQWNVLEGDYYTAGQQLQTTLLFNTEPPLSLPLPACSTVVREKVQFQIPAAAGGAGVPLPAEGVQAYSMSILHQMSVTVAPVLYQEDVYALLLADYRTSFDTYWQGFGGDLMGILPKECYFDYTSAALLTVQLFCDGDNAYPYYLDGTGGTYQTLQPLGYRSTVRVQFPARKGRLWRMVVTSPQPFQLWAPLRPSVKPSLEEGSGWEHPTFPVYQ